MSKKRKRETGPVITNDKNSPPAKQSEGPELIPKKDKSKSKLRKALKDGRDSSPEDSSTKEVNFASLANIPDTDSPLEENKEASESSEGEGAHDLEDVDNESMDVDSPLPAEDGSRAAQTSKPKKEKKQKKEDLSTGHKSILSKFDKYRAEILASTPAPAVVSSTPEEPLQGLHPLPQPAQAPVPKLDPNSVLPSYLSQPTTVPTTQRPPFSSFKLPEQLLDRLQKLGFNDTFPVQSALLPLLLPSNDRHSPSVPRSDLLVSAATGSGKTLSYLLPILSSLMNRSISHTYALIIVPTHELATQVQRTAHSLASGTSLKISTAIGTRSFDVEKEHIIANDIGSTGADILIATPGRLVEHIRNNQNFTLRHLQWLVVDEADRLLSQSFQDWVDIIGSELQRPFSNEVITTGNKFEITSMGLRIPNCAADNVRKVILSATMTRDVGKLAGLKLRRPQLIAVDDIGGHEISLNRSEDLSVADDDNETALRELNSLPSTLEEHYYPVSNAAQKPLILATLLSDSKITSGVLIFTKSNESAARLARLLEMLFAKKLGKRSKGNKKREWNVAVSTSDKRKKEISANTAKFKASTIDILISTDLMARGVDLPNAQLVINYDSPRNEKDYIHRVGRTARAGNRGVAWSLVEISEARWWWAGIGKVRRVSSSGLKKENSLVISEENLQIYEDALEKLGKEVRGP